MRISQFALGSLAAVLVCALALPRAVAHANGPRAAARRHAVGRARRRGRRAPRERDGAASKTRPAWRCSRAISSCSTSTCRCRTCASIRTATTAGASTNPASRSSATRSQLDKPNNPTIGATYATSPLPKVCNSGPVVGIPQLAWVGKLTDKLALGAGFEAPTVVTGLQFGGDDGTIDTQYGPRPTPTRYQLIDQEAKFALAPMVGAAYQVHPMLSLGADAAGRDARRRQPRGPERTIRARSRRPTGSSDIDAHDYFVPTVTFSVHAKPIPALDLMASFRWADNFNGSGNATYETNTFHDGATVRPDPVQERADQAQSGQGRLAVAADGRRALRGLLPGVNATSRRRARTRRQRAPRSPGSAIRWIASCGTSRSTRSYNFNERAEHEQGHAGEDVTLITREAGGGGDSQTQTLDDLSKANVDRHLRDSIALRAGGSFSVLPRKVAVDAGVFFESRGIDPAYASIDSFAFQRVGFGLGGMVRARRLRPDGRLRAHLRGDARGRAAAASSRAREQGGRPDAPASTSASASTSTTTTRTKAVRAARIPSAPSPARPTPLRALQQSSAVTSPARPERVINAGKYTAAFNIISVGAIYHF